MRRVLAGDEVADELKIPRTNAHRWVHDAMETLARRLGGREAIAALIDEQRA